MEFKKGAMKKVCVIALLLLIGSQLYSQSRAQVIIEQIVKLETYLSWLKKGYDIANKGLNLISDIKHGDFNLHQDYFNSLMQVKSPIKNDAKIAAMIAMQVQMLASYKSYSGSFQSSGVFTSQEITYLQRVFTAVLDDVGKDITELTAVITDGQLQMKDNQRVNRIDNLYTSMTGKYEFLYSFGDQVQLQAAQRRKELQETQQLQKLY
jgi:hypothetical protein